MDESKTYDLTHLEFMHKTFVLKETSQGDEAICESLETAEGYAKMLTSASPIGALFDVVIIGGEYPTYIVVSRGVGRGDDSIIELANRFLLIPPLESMAEMLRECGWCVQS